MGMSASQARLLSLTARQSNLEFEGQQINQQRTCLSNQSANYYNSLLSMKVPTPPSTDDYTTVKYDFTIGGNTATISQVLPQDNNGNYLVSYTTNLSTIGIQENTAYKISATANASSEKEGKRTPVTNSDIYDPDNEYYILAYREDSKNDDTTIIDNTDEGIDTRIGTATNYFDKYGNEVDESVAVVDGKLQDDYKALVSKTSNAEQGYSLVYVKLSDAASYTQALKDKGEKVYKFEENTIDTTYGTDKLKTLSASNNTEFSSVSSEYADAFLNAELDINDYYQYESATGIRFAKKKDVSKATNTDGLTISTFAVASLTTKQTHTLTGVQVEFDSSGRIATITDADGQTYTMTASTITDDAAYEDAYNQYTYDQYVYDQRQNEINANIEILQAQDKNLELRLSQLNTEHSAIQTEMDAVNKVLSKNIESSFKTFNA